MENLFTVSIIIDAAKVRTKSAWIIGNFYISVGNFKSEGMKKSVSSQYNTDILFFLTRQAGRLPCSFVKIYEAFGTEVE